MAVDHDAVFGGFFDDVAHVVHHPLRSVMLGTRYDGSDIAGLYGIVIVVFHESESCIELTLVVGGIGGGLMVHNHLDTL